MQNQVSTTTKGTFPFTIIDKFGDGINQTLWQTHGSIGFPHSRNLMPE